MAGSPTKWNELIDQASGGLESLTGAIEQLTALRDASTAEVSKYLRAKGGVELDIDAIQASLTRPYTIIPINEKEANLIHWRGVKMPIFGWVVKQEASFTISRVSRGMDLLTPLPEWARKELGWKPPEHAAIVDATRGMISVQQGDMGTFKSRYGRFLGNKVGDDEFKIKGGDAWVKLVAELIKDGILPFAARPVAKEDWLTRTGTSIVELRDYQVPFVKEFREKGAIFLNIPPGAGKTMVSLYVINRLNGPVLILAPSVILCEQWRSRVKQYAPEANVTILTYASGRKALKSEWSLVIFDEVQTLPANTFSKLAFINTKYRIGLSASPWREDGRQYMITALSGFPCSIRWADLIRAGVLKRPRVVIATVPTEASKTAFTKQLIQHRKPGRALIFCDYLQAGQQLADALDVPFVSGATSKKLEKVIEAEVCVVSRVADRGLDFTDLSLVVEWAFMGKSREQEAQRLGRLLHSQTRGEHYLLFTPQEAERFKPRIFGIESELAGEIDLEFMSIGKVADIRERAVVIRQRPSRKLVEDKNRRVRRVDDSAISPETHRAETSGDDIDKVMALRPIWVKLTVASNSVGESTRPYIKRVFRYCYSAALSPKEIADGLGITGSVARSRISSSCKALANQGLLVLQDDRYKVSKDEVDRAKALSRLI